MWEQDKDNIHLNILRFQKVNLPYKIQKINKNFNIIPKLNNSKNILTENVLLKKNNTKNRDMYVSRINSNISNKLLFHKFHEHEINSPCYPHIDRSLWDTTTKSIYLTSTIEKS